MRAEMGPSRGATMVATRPAISRSAAISSRESGLSRFALSTKIDAPRRSPATSLRRLPEFKPVTPKATDRKINGFTVGNTRPFEVGVPTRPFEKVQKPEKQPFRLIKRTNLNGFSKDTNRTTFQRKFVFNERIQQTESAKSYEQKSLQFTLQKGYKEAPSNRMPDRTRLGLHKKAELKSRSLYFAAFSPEAKRVGKFEMPRNISIKKKEASPAKNSLQRDSSLTLRMTVPNRVEVIPRIKMLQGSSLRDQKMAKQSLLEIPKQRTYEAFTAKREYKPLLTSIKISPSTDRLQTNLRAAALTKDRKSDFASALRVADAYVNVGFTQKEAYTKVAAILQAKKQEPTTSTEARDLSTRRSSSVEMTNKYQTEQKQKAKTQTQENILFLQRTKEQEQAPIICFVESLRSIPSDKTAKIPESQTILGRYIDRKNPRNKNEKTVPGVATRIDSKSSLSGHAHNGEICTDCLKMAAKKHLSINIMSFQA